MSRVVVFLICLSFLVLRGNAFALTAARQHHHTCAPLRSAYLQQWTGCVNSNRDRHTITAAATGTEGAYFVSEAVEEEDPDSFAAKKYRLLAYLTLLSLFIFMFRRKCAKAPPSVQAYLSHKYITQRVLRI